MEYLSRKDILEKSKAEEEELSLLTRRVDGHVERETQHVYRKKWAGRKEYS